MKIRWRFEKRRLTENEEKVKRKEIKIGIAHKVANALVAWMQAEGEVCNLTQLQES